MIVDVEATSAHRIQEVEATRTMIDRVEDRFAIKPTRLIGDMSYGTAELLAWMANDKAIEPHVPVSDEDQNEPMTHFPAVIFSGTNNATNTAAHKAMRCAVNGVPFKNPRSHITKADRINYTARQSDCSTCPLKARCCFEHTRSARSLAAFMKLRAMWLVPSPKPLNTSNRAKIERKSRCSLRTSSGS